LDIKGADAAPNGTVHGNFANQPNQLPSLDHAENELDANDSNQIDTSQYAVGHRKRKGWMVPRKVSGSIGSKALTLGRVGNGSRYIELLKAYSIGNLLSSIWHSDLDEVARGSGSNRGDPTECDQSK
jgi:hypothetical protein